MESAQRRQHLSEKQQLLAENKALKKKLEAAELSVRELKLSVYDLSARLSAALARNGNGLGGGVSRNGGNGNGGENGGDLAASLVDLSDGRTPASVVASVGDTYQHGEKGEGASLAKPADGRLLSSSCSLAGHAGAVYAVSFSPDGRLLASGSFDKTVRCWAMDEVEPGETLCLQKHAHNVSSLSWSGDSRSLLSGSYDHTVRMWDIEAATCARVWYAPEAAFVQSIAYHPSSTTLFAAATTSSSLLLFDARASSDRPVAELPNGVMVNTVCFLPRGDHVLTGDKHGALRTWDLRQRQCVAGAYAGDARKPISHVSISPPLPGGRGVGGGLANSTGLGGGSLAGGFGAGGGYEPRLLAVNSYDDTLRVYNKGFAPSAALGPPPLDGASPLDPHTPRQGSPARPDSSNSSHSNSSSHGASPHGAQLAGATGGAESAQQQSPRPVAARDSNHSSTEGAATVGGGAAGERPVDAVSEQLDSGDAEDADPDDGHYPSYYAECAHALCGHRNRSYPIRSAIHVGAEYTSSGRTSRPRSSVVDTYSAGDDARRDLYFMGEGAVGAASSSSASSSGATVHTTVLLATGSADGDAYVYDVGGPSGSGELVQRLRGHTDRVYAVDFHPHEPILASGSADFSVRLWAPQISRRRKRGGERVGA